MQVNRPGPGYKRIWPAVRVLLALSVRGLMPEPGFQLPGIAAWFAPRIRRGSLPKAGQWPLRIMHAKHAFTTYQSDPVIHPALSRAHTGFLCIRRLLPD